MAVVAGGGAWRAVAIGASMTLIQLGIGALNDVVDAPRDAGRKPGKPIPAGFVPVGAARIAALGSFAAGLILAAVLAPGLAGLGIVVVAIGLAYDLRLKGTAWSWLPFAVGIPILPVYGWFGAAGTLAPVFAVLTPVAVAAGAALAIGNALVDVERDRAAGVSSIALALGMAAASRLATGLLLAIWAIAIGSALVGGAAPTFVGGVAIVGAGPVAASIAAGRGSPAARERAWQAEAIGLAALATVWLVAVLGSART